MAGTAASPQTGPGVGYDRAAQTEAICRQYAAAQRGLPYDTMYAQCMYARGYRVPGFSPSPNSPGYQGELPGPALHNGGAWARRMRKRRTAPAIRSSDLRRSSWLLFLRRLRPTASLFRPRQSAGPRSIKPHSSCWHGMPRRY